MQEAEAERSPSDEKTGHPTLGVLFHSGAGNEARTRSPASREWLAAIRRSPASPLIGSRLRRGVEAARSPSDEKTGHPTLGVLFHSGAGNEARTRFPASREWLAAIRRNPASPLIKSRLRRGVEAACSPSDEKTGHPTLGVLFHSGAGNEARTRYLHLGKVALYQMSYARGTRGILAKKYPLVKSLIQDFPHFLPQAAGPSQTR